MSTIRAAQRRVAAVHSAYRFALDPTIGRRRALSSHCGAARFAFNWGLEQVKTSMALREFELCMFGEVRSELVGWSKPELRREWNRSKALVAPWWAVNSKEAYSSGLAALAAALKNWGDSRDYTVAGDDVSTMGCVFREVCDEARDVVCALHAGVLEGALGAAGSR